MAPQTPTPTCAQAIFQAHRTGDLEQKRALRESLGPLSPLVKVLSMPGSLSTPGSLTPFMLGLETEDLVSSLAFLLAQHLISELLAFKNLPVSNAEFVLKIFLNNFSYLDLVALGLRCCTGLSRVLVSSLLNCGGLSCCGAPGCVGLGSCGSWAQ